MGQVNSNVDAESAGELGSSIVVGVPNGEDDSRGSNQSGGEAMDSAIRDKMDSIHCVKTRIDMLIEDCLNVKDASGDEEEQSDKEKNGENGNKSKEKKESHSESDKINEEEVKSVNSPKSGSSDVVVVDKQTSESDKSEVKLEGDKKCENKAGGFNDSGGDGNEKSGSSADRIKVVGPGNKTSETTGTKKLKMADLINDMNETERSEQHKRAVTTFQTFIDKVLDSSLKQVSDQDNIPTNILKLCQESMQPIPEGWTASNAGAAAKDEKTSPGSGSPASKTKLDKACTKIKPERKITLKDHIERFLELSFQEETRGGDKHGSRQGEVEKKEGNGSKNGYDNFNAQGLVNNMITQGIQIKELLSPPPILVNHSKNPQKSPDIRVRTNYSRPEDVKYPHGMDVKSEVQVPSVSYKSELGGSKGNGYHNMPHRPGHHLPPQLSPGHINSSSHNGLKMAVKDMHEGHPAQHMDSKLYEGGRRDMYGRQYPPDYGPDHLPRPHPSVTMPGFHPRMEHAVSLAALDQPSPHHPGMYPMAPSRTSSAAGPYHPHLSVPHSAALEEQRSQLVRPGRHPLHHKDCMCPLCLGHGQPSTLDIREQKKQEYLAQRRSPNVPLYMASHDIPLHLRGHAQEGSGAVLRPSHAKLAAGAVATATAAYQTMPKLLPQHPPITSTKEYVPPQLMVPGMAYHQGRRPSLPDNSAQRPYSHHNSRPSVEYSPGDQAEEYARRLEGLGRGSSHSPYPVRPSSMPSHDNSSHDSYENPNHWPGTEASVRRSPASDTSSRSSEASTEAPLDLTVKKTKSELERPRSSSYSSGGHVGSQGGQKKLNPSNTFLRHLENSVDKYCQQEQGMPGADPLVGMKQVRPPISGRSGTPGDSSKHPGLPYLGSSPRLTSPHNLYNLQQQRKLPSPHFTGGITMGQPLVESKSQPVSTPRSAEFPYAGPGGSAPQTASPVSTLPQPIIASTTPSSGDSKRNINTISKHEPIQNIIGSHDPNDILYLICKICTQTYGSPYGFRKHFRNQHGFEPRAEHTIVQTISATKTALHGPVTMGTNVTSGFQSQQTVSPPGIKLEAKESTGFVVQSTNPEVDRKSSSGSPMNRRCPSESGSEHSEKSVSQKEKFAQDDVSERKYLECPECGKTFQLNDFGSYKRHCRQHSSFKVTGPYTCSDCHLSFPDQKALKEHYIVHVNESHSGSFESAKSAENVAAPKTSTSGMCFSCVKCDIQFGNSTAYNSHMAAHEQPPKLSPQAEVKKNKQTVGVVTTSDASKTVTTSINVIPSHCIVKQAAESMTSQECPDSSWDDSVKPVPSSAEEKPDEPTVDNSDSDYSSGVGSNSMVTIDEKVNENVEKSPAGVVHRQKSLDSNSDNNEEQTSDGKFFYKHKKFSHYRKREGLSIHSSDITPPKQVKLSDTSSDRGPPVSSSTTFSVDLKQCDSSQSEDTKSVDTRLNPELNTEVTEASSGKEADLSEKQHVKEVNLGKAEARHNLPFVWDRTTRSQRKTK